jgi:ATP-binding cassette subfamily B protein
MSSSSLALPDPFLFPAVAAAPSDGLTRLHSSLLGGEAVRAILTTDLNDELRAAQSVVMLTSHRLLTWRAATADTSAGALQAIDLHAGQSLVLHDHAGVATMELLAGEQRLAVWRFTLGANLWAQKLVLQFGLVQRELAAPEASRALAGVHGPLPEDDDDRDEVTSFAAEVEQPPSTWTLLRLWRFARPYQWQLLAGFLLMLASTAATLVPPYLTMPLMDDILIPFQNGKPIEQGVVLMYLGGLLASAMVAWGLGWAKTYILALVSERIGADLRTNTYEHLMGLSLEYFGGKRTGDLMARIGSETDRINVFLSLHLLDFATDVLMIVMTAAILFSINPWLALVTLVPLPFIAWLIHLVRDRLRTGFEKIDRVWAEVTNVLADTIPGIRVVKAFAQEDREATRFRDANRYNLSVNDKLNRTWSLFTPTVTLMTEIGLLVVWAFGIWQVSQNAITVGVLTAFLAYIGRFYMRLDSMSRIVSVTQKAAAGAKRIFDVLDHVSSVPEPANPVALTDVKGRIDIENAQFRYGNRAVIKGLNLSIEPGEFIGLGGSQWLGQKHAGQPDVPLLRREWRCHQDRRHRHTRRAGGGLPSQHRPGVAGALPVFRHHCREHCLWPARCHPCRHRGCRACRPCARVHFALAAGLRLAGGRAGAGTCRAASASAFPLHVRC